MRSKRTFFMVTMLVVAIIALSLPSALGVKTELQPVRGEFAAWSAAVGIELWYIAVSLLPIPLYLQKEARRAALSAVVVAVLLNVLADYREHIHGSLDSWAAFSQSFDGLVLVISAIESAPLASLAFVGARLLHRFLLHETVHTPQEARVFGWRKRMGWLRANWGKVNSADLAAGFFVPVDIDVVISKALVEPLGRREELALRDVLLAAKEAETKTATIARLWKTSSGASFASAARLYDRLIDPDYTYQNKGVHV